MPRIIYREDLDRALQRGCDDPTCLEHGSKKDAIFLAQTCHKGAGLDVRYSNGRMQLICVECHMVAAVVSVGSGN